MDEVVTRIVAIERQCSAEVEQARQNYSKNIESRRRSLEEEKSRALAQITASENLRLARAIEEAQKKTGEASAAFQRDCEIPFQNPALIEAVREDIISILFGG